MKTKLLCSVIILSLIISACDFGTNTRQENTRKIDNPILGKWIKEGHNGSMSLEFKDNGTVEGDLGMDQTIDVVDAYEIKGDTISFVDKKGQMCSGIGTYKIYQTDYYLAFDLIKDDCGGRIKQTMGYWTKPDYKNLLDTLDEAILNQANPDLYLNRARVYMALGESMKAQSDLDVYILTDSTDARVYINRAGTRFPYDLTGVVKDCNKAIVLEPGNKNAYFLRGLALYDLGEEEKACSDFKKAIDLGFSFLKIAEQQKCNEYWNKN